MNKATCIKTVLRVEGFDAYRALLLRVVKRKGGNLTRVAFELGISGRHLRRCLMFANLWDEVVAARAAPRQDRADPLARALLEL